MSTWRVVAVLAMGAFCLTLGSATVVVPMTDSAEGSRWLWMVGLYFATAAMGTMFALFLRSCGRTMK